MTAGWIPMMAAMMLPSALPAMARRTSAGDGALAVPRFAGAYAAVWALVGLAFYALYQPPGPAVAAALIVLGGAYEISPLKLEFRRRCREGARSGVQFGLACLGSTVGLMLILIAADPMSTAWMVAIALIALAQKLLTPNRLVDVSLAGALVVLALI